MKKILMRADDLGYSEAVNLGIYKSVHDGMIKNVGLMANMIYAKHGICLLENENICLGLHVNISAGKPVRDFKEVQSLVDENGNFKTSKVYKKAIEDIDLKEVLSEIEAQYDKFIELTGKEPAYMDAHAVKSKNFMLAVKMIADKHGIKNTPPFISIDKPVTIDERLVFLNGGSALGKTPFECLKEVVEEKQNEIEMIIYHPGFVDAYLMNHSSLNIQRVFELEMLCDDQTKQYLKSGEVELITFNDL